MAKIKDLKKKIKSVKGTLKITTAMKLVSASKLSRMQHAIQAAKPYSKELEQTVEVISALVKNYSHTCFMESSNKNAALIVISSNKGLCGGYNTQLIKEVQKFLDNTDLNIKLFFIGKKAKEILVKTHKNFDKIFMFKNLEPGYEDIKNIGEYFFRLFKSEEISKVFIAFNIFNSAISFKSVVKQVLPIPFDKNERNKIVKKFPFDFKYDPSPKEILDTLILESYFSIWWISMLNAMASEHGSRMSSMENASNNCKDLIKKLTLRANKLRQAAITTELVEVISGAESLNT